MIRKILVQDIVSKRAGKNAKEADDIQSRTVSARERDFLIERLTKKHTTETPTKSATKVSVNSAKPARATPRRKKSSTSRFNHKWLWFSLPLALIVIIFLVMQFFASATVTITPSHISVATSTTLLASNTATTSSTPGPVTTSVSDSLPPPTTAFAIAAFLPCASTTANSRKHPRRWVATSTLYSIHRGRRWPSCAGGVPGRH